MSCTNLRKLFSRSPSRPKHFYYSVRPIVVVSRCYGLNPFSYETNVYGEVHRIKITFSDSVWFIVAVGMYLSVAIILSTQTHFPAEFKSVFLLVLGDRMLAVHGLVMCAVSIIMDMMNRDRILQNVQRFQAFDTEVWRNGKRNLQFNEWKVSIVCISRNLLIDAVARHFRQPHSPTETLHSLDCDFYDMLSIAGDVHQFQVPAVWRWYSEHVETVGRICLVRYAAGHAVCPGLELHFFHSQLERSLW